MKRNVLIRMFLCGICVRITLVGLALGAEDANKPLVSFQAFEINGSLEQSSAALIQLVDIQRWPVTNVWRVAPKIDKSMLSQPDLITHEHISYGIGPFRDRTWAVGVWSWRRRVQSNEPLPTDLPPEHKQRLMAFLAREGKLDDPNFVKEFLNRKLESYGESKRYRIAGRVTVRVCVAPNSRSAEEYLILQNSGSQMSPDIVASRFSESKRAEDLGTIGFGSQGSGSVMFARDNIAVIIDVQGDLAGEGFPLAKKIDSLILQQSPLTYEQLLSRRPSLTIAASIDKEKINGRRALSYSLTVPNSQDIVCLRGSTVKGQYEAIEGGKILLPNKVGPCDIELIAITNELLANRVEKQIDVSD